MPTLFEKICAGEIPADIVFQDELCVCFRDIAPQAPTHLLLVPRVARRAISATRTTPTAIAALRASLLPPRGAAVSPDEVVIP
jgi:diadenosine tetraphosphate (Ap4A) HIT family hydrolase